MIDNLGISPLDNNAVMCDRPMGTAGGFAVGVEGVQEKLTRLAGELGLRDYQLWAAEFGPDAVLVSLKQLDFETLPFCGVEDC